MIKVAKALLPALVFVASVGLGSGARAQAQGESKVIPVGASLTIAPYSFVNEKNENVGFELDILNEAAKRMGVKLEVRRIPFAQLSASLDGGIVRIAASGVLITCERLANRAKVGHFSLPTFANGQVITTRAKDADNVKSFEDLAGKKVGVETVGTVADRVVTKAQEKTKFEKVVFADNPSLFLALEQGRIDAAAQTEFATLWQTRGNDKLRIAARVPETRFFGGFLFKEGDSLREDFNKVLNDMKNDGTLAGIYRSWFNADPAPDSPTALIIPEVTLTSMKCQ
jgi:polar amino acid transport system substrate-binding protein